MRLWPVTLILVLLPLWCCGLFGRGYWSPDEPREVDIAWNMAQQKHHAIPRLAGVPFCEKPPLTYWASGVSLAVFGKSPAAARLPNLVWAVLAVLAIAWLAYGCAGIPAALVAGVATATFALSFQVSVWLATDAPLVAGVCVALLGAFRGLTSTNSREKLAWYTLMHVGMVLGFFAKNVIALLIPGLAVVFFIVWERRWRELLRWELYVGFTLQIALIGTWILAVAQHPDGRHALKILFYDNLVGRFFPVASENMYIDGHRNVPFKYVYQLPVFLLPWTFLVAAALYRCWRGVRDLTIDRQMWRWCVCIVLPSLALLSFSSTGRGIYIAPVLPGFALALGIWAARHVAEPDRFELLCLWLTGGVCTVAAFAIGPAILLVAGYTGQPLDAATTITVILGGLATAALAVKLHFQQRRGAHAAALITLVLTLNLMFLLSWRGIFPLVDRWQDLAPTMARVATLAENRSLVLWRPDETTIAQVDFHLGLRPPIMVSSTKVRELIVGDPRLAVLALISSPADTDKLLSLGLRLFERLDIPHGRTYGVFVPATGR